MSKKTSRRSRPTRWAFIGDVHGYDEGLRRLLLKLGCAEVEADVFEPPKGLHIVFVGDLVDRGPDSLRCLSIARAMHAEGWATVVLGNHEWRFRQLALALLGREDGGTRIPPSRLITWLQLLACSAEARQDWLGYVESLPTHAFFDDDRVVAAHAAFQARGVRLERDEQVELFAFGRVSHEQAGARSLHFTHDRPEYKVTTPDAVLPPRARWAQRHRNGPHVVWGHDVAFRSRVAARGGGCRTSSSRARRCTFRGRSMPCATCVLIKNWRTQTTTIHGCACMQRRRASLCPPPPCSRRTERFAQITWAPKGLIATANNQPQSF